MAATADSRLHFGPLRALKQALAERGQATARAQRFFATPQQGHDKQRRPSKRRALSKLNA